MQIIIKLMPTNSSAAFEPNLTHKVTSAHGSSKDGWMIEGLG